MNFSLILLLLIVMSFCLNAQPDSAGKTLMAKGAVEAESEQQSRFLKRRSPVFMSDLVSTGIQSATQLRMLDGGLLSLQADSQLAIENYQFEAGGSQNSVSMSLIKGGLRTVTGALTGNGDNYQLTTPVASIGVRGTHYEAELLDNDLYLACWEGQIQIDVTVPNAFQTFYLGPEENYKFAVVRQNGEVEFLIQGPVTFAEGHVPDVTLDNEDPEPQFALAPLSIGAQEQEQAFLAVANDVALSGEELFDNDVLVGQLQPSEIIQRNGQASFDLLSQQSFTSSVSSLNNISMDMQINFDSARVPTGSFSATDSGGEWFAVFNGFIDQQALQLDINFASHANQLADGSIEAILLNDASGVFGQLNLFELNDASRQLDGSFLLVESNP